MFILPKRMRNTYKKDFGSILILAGNEIYGGAAILSARAALYSGAGLVTLATHPLNHSPMHSLQPEIMIKNWQDDLNSVIQSSDIVLIGPGLGTDGLAKKLFQNTLDQIEKHQTVILDASALHLFRDIKMPKCHLVLTPHIGEMRALSGLVSEEISDISCLDFSKEHGAYLILKSHQSKLYCGGKIYENITGTPAMATGGAGDVLAGMIAGFMGQFEPLLAIRTALYLHSKIALDLSEENFVVLPTRIIEKIPREMKKLESKNSIMI